MFFDKKEQQVRQFMKRHVDRIKECLVLFEKTISLYLDGHAEEANVSSYNVHKKEHEADVVRREIIAKLADGAFLPFIREDFIDIVELIDEIANRAKTVTQTMVIQMPKIPQELHADIRMLTTRAVEAIEPLVQLMEGSLLDREKSMALIQEISAREQAADAIEFKLLKRLFQEIDITLAEKILISELLTLISEIADAVEDVGDRIQVLISKQAV
ncbi:MAG: TIGR00153 family protein [Candidatus Aureabacteria bacterium]|nr:TIGR00153 family protein [Candidatus Auribacterota bacterium]NLW94219.1 TIGR00153 family protein [Chlamydiota bacterium]HQM51568.1 TIGR00153 family protein [bacterium]